jgi:hypothetical protein
VVEAEWHVWSEAWVTEAEWASGPCGRRHGQRCPNATVEKLALASAMVPQASLLVDPAPTPMVLTDLAVPPPQ